MMMDGQTDGQTDGQKQRLLPVPYGRGIIHGCQVCSTDIWTLQVCADNWLQTL